MDEKEDSPLKQIRTFQGDVAEALRKQRESLVSIQQVGHLREGSIQYAAEAFSESSQIKKKAFYFFLGSFLLFALGMGGAWYAYHEFVSRIAPPIVIAPLNRFVSADIETSINLTDTSREALINTLSSATLSVPRGEIKHLVLRKVTEIDSTLVPTSEFLKILDSRAPGSLVRSFDPLFMFGAFGDSTFLIIKLVSFENAFAGMLSWEKTLSHDLGPLFATAPFLKNIGPEPVFSDMTDRNKDVRVLASGGEPLLLYSFFDNNMLIITDNIETLRTLVDRLTREKLSR